MGSNENLENLLRSGGLKAEPPDRKECEGLMRSAVDRLKDAQTSSLSFASRFDLAYNAAHALALTALRLCGYRSDKRYLVFQCLVHTADIGKVQVRLFALCHERRNLAEYEGYMDEDPALLAQLLKSAEQLLIRIHPSPQPSPQRGGGGKGSRSSCFSGPEFDSGISGRSIQHKHLGQSPLPSGERVRVRGESN